MDELYCGPARQVHFNRVVAEYHGWFAQDLRDLAYQISGRGVSGEGYDPAVMKAMERICMVTDTMLEFDGEYAELLVSRWKATGEAPTVNPFSDERAGLVLRHPEGDGRGVASGIPQHCRLIKTSPDHLQSVAHQVLEAERYRAKREYARRRELFKIQTAGPPAGAGVEPQQATANCAETNEEMAKRCVATEQAVPGGAPTETHHDGPEEPDTFWCNGRGYEISGRKFRLLKSPWVPKKVSFADAIDEVWFNDEISDQTVKNAASELGTWFLEKNLPFGCHVKSAYIYLSDAPAGN